MAFLIWAFERQALLFVAAAANHGVLRALCNGKTLAFQAKDAGSIPAARSIHSVTHDRRGWYAALIVPRSAICLHSGDVVVIKPLK